MKKNFVWPAAAGAAALAVAFTFLAPDLPAERNAGTRCRCSFRQTTSALRAGHQSRHVHDPPGGPASAAGRRRRRHEADSRQRQLGAVADTRGRRTARDATGEPAAGREQLLPGRRSARLAHGRASLRARALCRGVSGHRPGLLQRRRRARVRLPAGAGCGCGAHSHELRRRACHACRRVRRPAHRDRRRRSGAPQAADLPGGRRRAPRGRQRVSHPA